MKFLSMAVGEGFLEPVGDGVCELRQIDEG